MNITVLEARLGLTRYELSGNKVTAWGRAGEGLQPVAWMSIPRYTHNGKETTYPVIGSRPIFSTLIEPEEYEYRKGGLVLSIDQSTD